MKRMLALFLGILLLASLAQAEGADPELPEAEDYLVPRQFMSMFDASFKISADLLRGSVGDEEADRLVEEFALTEYDADDDSFCYGSKDWAIEIVFPFEKPEDVSPDNPAFRWYLCLDDNVGENAARLTMYTLKMMISYRYRDVLDDSVVQRYFETFTLGEPLPLPDGYEFVILRPEDADYVVFAMQPPA